MRRYGYLYVAIALVVAISVVAGMSLLRRLETAPERNVIASGINTYPGGCAAAFSC